MEQVTCRAIQLSEAQRRILDVAQVVRLSLAARHVQGRELLAVAVGSAKEGAASATDVNLARDLRKLQVLVDSTDHLRVPVPRWDSAGRARCWCARQAAALVSHRAP